MMALSALCWACVRFVSEGRVEYHPQTKKHTISESPKKNDYGKRSRIGPLNKEERFPECANDEKRDNEKPKTRTLSRPGLVGEGGFAFLRKSHGGCDSPPDCRQEPPFESTFPNAKTQKDEPSARMSRLSGGGRWIRRRLRPGRNAYMVVISPIIPQ